MKTITTILLLIFSAGSVLAANVKGKVLDENGEPLPGVNVYIKDTYDGGTTDLDGNFSFTTYEEGEQTLLAQFVGYTTFELVVDLSKPVSLDINLKEEVSRLSGVTITAGSFEASDERKATVLKPLDIATTAGALADIPGALSTLPGTTKNGETGRLFVRGGSANETQAFIDGIKVHNFYTPAPNNVPSRSRFSPFLFKGTFFSTGGYSAEYGQALSSVLSLSSNDMPTETRTDISLMSVGLGASRTQKYETGSVFGEFNYFDLNPYNDVIEQEIDWKTGFVSHDGTFMWRQKTNDTDMIKFYTNYNKTRFKAVMPDVNNPEGSLIDLENGNVYVNSTYRKAIGDNSAAHFGASVGQTNEDIVVNDSTFIDNQENGFHVKSNVTTDIGQVTLKTGVEVIYSEETDDARTPDGDFVREFDNAVTAGFAEADYFITNDLTIRGGLRYSHYSLFDKHVVSPRLSMAYKTGEYSQLSWAYGKFHQLPENDLLLNSQQMSFEEADHYMMSYQSIMEKRTVRAEIYRKNYNNLVKFDPTNEFNPTLYNNDGDGYAQGVDLFFRDNQTFPNIDYWVSYSYIDTKRNFRDYPTTARPTFASQHNLSLVYKQFFSAIRTQVGATYSFNSGRPYNNPNVDNFNGNTTKTFNELSFNFAYLYRPNIILYASASNLLGTDNVFGYEYADQRNPETNQFDRRAIGQPAKRFFFVGIFITLTKDGVQNNLENL